MNRSLSKIACCALALTFVGITAFAADTKSGEKGTSSESLPAEVRTKPVDINSATKDQLMITLGIDEEYARKIIEGRPYEMKTQLRTKGVLPPEIFYEINDRIVVIIDDKQQKTKLKKK